MIVHSWTSRTTSTRCGDEAVRRLPGLARSVGAERKTRSAAIVSPDELNEHLSTVVVVPLTTGRTYPFRPATRVRGKARVAAVDQIRTLDKSRLTRRVGALDPATGAAVLQVLGEMFAP